MNGALFGNTSGVISTGIKRGSDQMLGSTSALNPMMDATYANHLTTENNNEAKKIKVSEGGSAGPSRVVHIRNIPNEVTEAEVSFSFSSLQNLAHQLVRQFFFLLTPKFGSSTC